LRGFCLVILLALNVSAVAQVQPSVQIKQVRELIQASSFTKANLIIDGMLQKHPYKPELHYLKGICAFHLHDYTEAAASFTQAEPHAKQNEHLFYYRSLCYYFLQEFSSAYTDAKTALSLSPNDNEAVFLLAIIAKEQGKHEESISLLQPLFYTNDPSPEVFLLSASNFQAIDSVQKAINTLQIGAEVLPLNPNILSRMAMLEMQSGNLENVLSTLNDALLADSLHIYSWYTLSRYYRETGNNDAYIEATNKLISLNPFSALPYYDLGVFYYENGILDLAIQQLTLATDLAPGVALGSFALAEVYASRKNLNMAVQYYEETILRFPYHIEAHEKLVHYLSNSDATEARKHYQRQLTELKNLQDSIENDSMVEIMAKTALSYTPLFDQRWLPSENEAPHEPQPTMLHMLSAGETHIARAKKQGEFITTVQLEKATYFIGATHEIETKPLSITSSAIDSAIYFHSKNQLTKAEDILDRSINKAPVAPWFHLERACIGFDLYLLTSQFSSSEEVDGDQLQQLEFIARDLALEAQIQPNFPFAHYNLGIIYTELQMFEKAIEQFVIATSKDKSLAPAWHQLGIAYQQSGSSIDACNAWYKALQLNYPHSKKWVKALCP